MTTTDDDTLSLGRARERYFAANGFGAGGYEERWIRLKAGPVAFWLPNTSGRVRAVKLHDLHHVVTGYATTWTGEAEIGAWEIASGCGRFYPAWVLNLYAFVIGLLIAPWAVFRAFVRGRHSTNLYRTETELRDELLARSVGDLRRALRLDGPPPSARPADVAAFAVWSLAAVAFVDGPLALLLWWSF